MEIKLDIIKELKQLAIAHKCALEYDNCPSSSEVDWILNNILSHDKSDLILILDKYEGWSCGNIESAVFKNINSL